MRHPLRSAVVSILLMAAIAFALRADGCVGRSASPRGTKGGEEAGGDDTRLRNGILARLAQAVEAAAGGLLPGRNGWLFLPAEIRSLAPRTSVAATAELPASAAESLPSGLQGIRDFRAELAAQGVDLLVVLVPPKIAVYPENLLDGLPQRLPRFDVAAHEVLAELEHFAIPAVDLLPRFLQEKDTDPDDPLYVPTDSHWSSRGCLLAAQQIADRVTDLWPSLAAGAPRSEPRTAVVREPFPIESDLLALLPAGQRPERPTMVFHRIAEDPSGKAPESQEILLLGDSHLLVWRGRRAGLTDHLQRELGLALSQIAVRAGGPAVSRQALARREGVLAARKLVIWVFAARLLDPPPSAAASTASDAPAASPTSVPTLGRTSP